jgi:hypothetical protein
LGLRHQNPLFIFSLVDFENGSLSLTSTTDSGARIVQDKRSLYRKRVLKNAQIVLSEKAPKLDCSVRNLSTTGACLQVSTTFGIPVNFDVVIEGERRPCRSIWRTDTKIGVMFV